MKNILLTFVAISFAAAFAFLATQNKAALSQDEAPQKPSKAQRIEEAFKDNFERTKDLALGYPPVERLQKAAEQTRKMQLQYAREKRDLANVRFQERGPKNIGGRTRTILIDKNDPTGNTVWAGAVSGGLWKTENITAFDPKWNPIGDDFPNLTVGCMVQDPKNPQLMFVGTGEMYGGGNEFVGMGILRSTDGGDTWEQLPATTEGILRTAFQFTQDMLIDPSGDLYAATGQGLYRTSDQGESWELALTGMMHEIEYGSNGKYIATATGSVYRSATGNEGEWTNLSNKPGFPRNLARLESSMCKADPNIIYLLGNSGGDASDIYRTTDGGDTWQKRGIPQSVEGIPNFTRGQGWYDLTIAVDPFNCDRLVVGGIDLFRSFNGGRAWSQIAHWTGGFGLQYVHADQHIAVYDEERRGVLFFGNDGGVFRSTDGGTNAPNRNLGYNVTQFYAGDIHPEAYRSFFIGGTQDNGSLRLDDKNAPISNAVEVQGGDGFFAHIDQDDPSIQMVSLYFAAYGLSTNEGRTFGGGASLNGSFLSASDYDDEANILYSQTNEGDLYRWPVLGDGEITLMDILEVEIAASAVHADPNIPNRVYVGDFSGELYLIDNANEGDSFEHNLLHDFNAVISSIYVEPGHPEHILVTISNYGRANNVFESKDGGLTWVGCEGNLPDMPIRWGLFNPDEGAGGAVIATELGVWFTEKLEGANTVWLPPALGRGIPMVRTDMLQMRASDNVILAVTHGRGMFTTDVFAAPKAVLSVDRIVYEGAEVVFDGTASFGAETYEWDFGDGNTSTAERAIHIYDKIGEYEVSITINGSLSESGVIKVLPNKKLPYTAEEAQYSGSFDTRPEDYGVYTVFGTAFERGKSSVPGKDGTHTGDNAYVTGLEESFYEYNTHTMLYLPNFDFSEPGIYEFSFWSKAFMKDGFHGYNVEYSLDKGRSWRVLNNASGKDWYDYTNENLEDGVFPLGTSYFGFRKGSWTQHFTDITNLAGKENVAFRFVFKASDTGNFPGIAIDDVEITRYPGKAETTIVAANAVYRDSETAVISWTTQPEFYADEFILERSFNGIDFEPLSNGKVDAVGKVSSRVNNYSFATQGIRNLYFFRIRSISENSSRDYHHEFTTPVMAISRNLEENDVYRFFPNPFTDHLNLTFTGIVNAPIEIELFDAAGRLVLQERRDVSDVHTRIETGELAIGIYFLRYKIGDGESKVLRLLKR